LLLLLLLLLLQAGEQGFLLCEACLQGNESLNNRSANDGHVLYYTF
jgi:hypothetical protein